MSRYPSKSQSALHAAAATITPHDQAAETRPLPREEDLLLVYARTGNQRAFQQLVLRFQREIYSYLRNYLGDAHLAEDAFQATFLQLHLKCRQFQPHRRLRPWLYAIATHQAADLLRRNRRHKALSLSMVDRETGSADEPQSLCNLIEATDPGPSGRLESAEERQRVRSALESLPVALRQLLDLVIYQELKYREVAAILGIPLGTVKSRMSNALAKLCGALAVHG